MAKKKSIIYEENYNTLGTLMKVVEDNGRKDIWVEFQDEYKYRVHTTRSSFKKGEVRNLYDKSVYKVGYLGVGEYNTNSLFYSKWFSMLRRCYDPYTMNEQPTYIDCYVTEEWYNFQNFAKWCDKNYYNYLEDDNIFGGTLCLDKDLLNKGNKIYSPNNCILIPHIINAVLTKSNRIRGEYPIGVTWNKKRGKYIAFYHNGILKKNISLGSFTSIKDAFKAYKRYKENYLKELADLFKERLGEHFYEKKMFQQIYDALYNYEVDIND